MNYTDLDNSNDCDKITNNCTDNENNIDILIPTLLLTIPCGSSFLCLMILMIYTLFKHSFEKKQMEKFFFPTQPVGCIITVPSECGKSVFLTNLL